MQLLGVEEEFKHVSGYRAVAHRAIIAGTEYAAMLFR